LLALSDSELKLKQDEAFSSAATEMTHGQEKRATRKLKILLDGFNRDLEHGTGIATYSRMLAQALQALGHETHWLFARSTPGGADALTEEVAFFDNGPDSSPPGTRLSRLMKRLRRKGQDFLHTSIDAHPIHEGGAVIRDPDRPYEPNAFNASELYHRAYHRHLRGAPFTAVNLKTKMDVFHLTAPLAVRVKNTHTVCTIHDLIPIRLPYTTTDNKHEIIRRLRSCAEHADLVFTVSESSKTDIVNILDVDPAKIAVTYQASDLQPFRPSERNGLPRVLARYGLEFQRFALFVSAIEPKKNLRRLIEAFLEVDTAMPLVIVGKRAWMWEKEIGNIEATFGPRALRRLRFLGYVPRNDLRYLYSGAAFLAFPSLYEGFGLPALEAMQFGCPVLTSNVSSLPEICGEAALYVEPFDRDDLREKLDRMVGEPDLRKWLSEAAKAQAALFSFDRYVTRLGEAYARLPA
jgi:glycosyltransferase involved in cell wall biosynthesis